LKKGYLAALIVFIVLLIDQASKFYIKTHFEYNEDVLMFGQEWARLHFVENEGMAFGITFGWEYGKLLLSLFRILMVVGLIWYTRLLMDAKAPTGFIMSIALITAGALGNIIDSTFYAMIFSDSTHSIAQMVPWGTGYGHSNELPMGGLMHGKVVDMLYFPMKYFEMPEWLGGDTWLFFSPIFNVADASITTGVLSILLFQRRFFRDGFMEEKPEPHAEILAEIDNLPEHEAEMASDEIAIDNNDTTISEANVDSEASKIDHPDQPASELGKPLL
jgi:signal peptidase II